MWICPEVVLGNFFFCENGRCVVWLVLCVPCALMFLMCVTGCVCVSSSGMGVVNVIFSVLHVSG